MVNSNTHITKINDAIIPESVKFLFNQFAHYGYEIYLVGGCIRDILLNREPSDWDMCTSAEPEEMLNLVKYINQQTNNPYIKTIPTGLQHGTITFIINGESVEVTTFRCDGKYSDNRRPDNVVFTKDLIEDLKRRDFTMNAIAYSLQQGFVDPFNGMEDIENGVIKCVGNPKDRFKEDALRILRCIRFSAQLDFVIDPRTDMAANELSGSLKNISYERITSELCKGLESDNPDYMLNNILLQIIPEITPMIGFDQHNPYHVYNLYNHTLYALNYEKTGNLIVRLAILFHDIGKPHCIQIDENGIYHFRGHGRVSADITERIMKRMRFDNDTINKVTQLVFYHDAIIEEEKKHIKKWLNRIGEEQFRNLLIVRECDIIAQNPKFGKERLEKIYRINQRLEEVLADDDCFTLKDLALNGYDLLQRDVPEGKIIGQILNHLLTLVMNGDIENTKEKLFEAIDFETINSYLTSSNTFNQESQER